MTDTESIESTRKVRSYLLPGKNIISVGYNADSVQNFKLGRIFEETDNTLVVFKSLNHMVEESLNGSNCTIFAYGQTGSGKTHTISGGPQKKGGLIQHSFDYIRNLVNLDKDYEY